MFAATISELFDAIDCWFRGIPRRIGKEIAAGASEVKASNPVTPATPVASGATIDPETAAIALLLDPSVGPNVTKIAEILGIPRTTVSGWPKFRQALDQVRGTPGRVRRGSKTAEGAIEVSDDD